MRSDLVWWKCDISFIIFFFTDRGCSGVFVSGVSPTRLKIDPNDSNTWHAVRVQSITVDCSSDDFLLEDSDEFLSKSLSCRLGKYEHSFRVLFLQGVFGRDANSLRNMRAEVNMDTIQFPNACSWFLLLIHYGTFQISTGRYGSVTQINIPFHWCL